jgi:transcriptional regulator with GAF, ATPase, and Fis domain
MTLEKLSPQQAIDANVLAVVSNALPAVSGEFEFLQSVLPDLIDRFGWAGVGLAAQRRGTWHCQCWVDRGGAFLTAGSHPDSADSAVRLPENLIAAAVDQATEQSAGEWLAVPFTAGGADAASADGSSSPRCFLVRGEDRSSDSIETDANLIRLLASIVSRLAREQRSRGRIEQLTRVLQAAATWQQTPLQDASDDALLRQIADSATQLLDCERASIFLWQKRRKKLVGRPALGIDDRPLEVPDNQGIVGEVLATKEPQIWNSDSDRESRVNRNVDRTTDFQTRSLVAVPLIGGRGETIGVFEAINHRENHFGRSHIAVLSDLALHAAIAIESHQTQRNLVQSRDRLVQDAASNSPLIGNHSSIDAIRETARKVAKTELSVLILGSNGTGKEVVARHIHYESERRNGPFVAVNCAALVESLLESELFGHERGSFTDANATRVGKFELASGGTLFLDEVGDMSPGGQAKLLRVLEQREVLRVGGSTPIPVDVRVIAATNQPLGELIIQKRFREDLYFRLNVVSLSLPDLAERDDDVLLLAEHFLRHFCYQIGRQVPQLSDSAKTALLSHAWPGNVRELRNTIERVCYLSSESEISAADLELRGGGRGSSKASSSSTAALELPSSLTESTRLFQINHIRAAIEKSGGNMTEAAARLELHRSNLYRKMKQLGMQTGDDLSDPS